MSEDGLTQAELFDVFSNARRRRTVRFLKRQHGSCDLAPLVEQVAAWENDVPREAVTRAQRRRVYISLYQTHLPMLEEHGIVAWDADGHYIELLPSEGTFDPYLTSHTDGQRSWHAWYASVALAGVAAFLLTWQSVGPLASLETPLVALVLSGAVFVLASVHHVSRRSSDGLPGPLARR
ncbi:DUF7344 domain-containing protein [Natronobiforma cellulositropha]|uniref:DUF7344 domain-containing protein n=1 Tax=Natronobiforma cellulositropha TaxID=1679076 RepID=UPI0021D5B921|nr:hypothetical protein [Natronobiforma cellulositropha]